MKSVLVTGGAGYIGSHTCLELLQQGWAVTVLDNFSNSHPESLRRVAEICGREVTLVEGDVRDRETVVSALRRSGATSVIHFAGLKAVGESVAKPLTYYEHNVGGSLRLLEAMGECGVHSLVFSSSATVYGDPQRLPLTEDHPLSTTNPYGQTKLVVEEMLRDLHRSDPTWRIAILRYFNPVGAHPSGRIGEDPQGVPNNLLPYVAQVAIGRQAQVNVWGNDYPTPDGTGVRDYIHVMDLAQGHLRALERLASHAECEAINLGTGTGYSVLEMVQAFGAACGRELPYRISARRAGDIAACYADPTKANNLLGWSATHTLQNMCADAWRWQQNNPQGYAGGGA